MCSMKVLKRVHLQNTYKNVSLNYPYSRGKIILNCFLFRLKITFFFLENPFQFVTINIFKKLYFIRKKHNFHQKICFSLRLLIGHIYFHINNVLNCDICSKSFILKNAF